MHKGTIYLRYAYQSPNHRPRWSFLLTMTIQHVNKNPGPRYDTLLLRLIQGYLLSACPHRQFHSLPDLLDSRAALPKSYPSALV